MNRLHPLSPLFPYTTLFRSGHVTERERRAPGSVNRERCDEMRLAFAHRARADALGAAERLDDASVDRSEEHTSELQSQFHLVCRLLLEKKNCPTPSRNMAHR